LLDSREKKGKEKKKRNSRNRKAFMSRDCFFSFDIPTDVLQLFLRVRIALIVVHSQISSASYRPNNMFRVHPPVHQKPSIPGITIFPKKATK